MGLEFTDDTKFLFRSCAGKNNFVVRTELVPLRCIQCDEFGSADDDRGGGIAGIVIGSFELFVVVIRNIAIEVVNRMDATGTDRYDTDLASNGFSCLRVIPGDLKVNSR